MSGISDILIGTVLGGLITFAFSFYWHRANKSLYRIDVMISNLDSLQEILIKYYTETNRIQSELYQGILRGTHRIYIDNTTQYIEKIFNPDSKQFHNFYQAEYRLFRCGLKFDSESPINQRGNDLQEAIEAILIMKNILLDSR